MKKDPNIKNEATTAMTQEDVLRELELLPMWHWRVSLPSLAPEAVTASPAPVTAATHLAPPAAPEPDRLVQTLPIQLDPEPVAAMAWTQVSSEDGLWWFGSATAGLSADEWQLLQNMAKAMRLSLKPPQAMAEPIHALLASSAKMRIVFGESAAQHLLASQESLPTLRGQLHACQGRTLVATHALDHLLQQPLDKAQTWDDLRLAMQALADLA